MNQSTLTQTRLPVSLRIFALAFGAVAALTALLPLWQTAALIV